MFYGLDVHKNEIQVCKLISLETDSKEESRFMNTKENLINFARSLTIKDQIVFEASFNSWQVHSILTNECDAKIVVANAHKVGLIAKSRIKTDKVDAFILAKLLRANFIPEVELPSEYGWDLRQLTSHRRLLSKQRTSIKNSINAILNKKLLRCPYSTPFTKKGIDWMRKLKLDEISYLILDNSISLLEKIEFSIKQVDLQIIKISAKNKEIQLLLSLPGIDTTAALGILGAIDDIEKFKSPEKLSSYFGLVPTISQSGDKCYHGRITKTGSKTARWLLTEGAQALVLTGCPLSAIYYRIKAKKGHNKAITALARKMTTIIWHMLKNKEPYRYAPSARTREKLRKLSPNTPAMERSYVSTLPIEEIYKEFNLPLIREIKPAEKRILIKNKKSVTRSRSKIEDEKDE